MRVLVTGSAGHIGRVQVQMLRDAGHEVRSFDRASPPKGDEGEHIFGDIRDILAIRRAVQGMEAVFHIGAIPGDRRGAEEDVLTVNVQSTWNVLLAARDAGIGRVVFFSSVQVLGNFAGHRASLHLPIGDDYPRHPMTAYQISKQLGEETCRCFSDRYEIVTIALRPVLVATPDYYGHWKHRPSEQRAEWGRADYWAYVDVRDVAHAGMLSLEVQGVKHDAFLLSANETTLEIPTAELVDRYYADTPWLRDRAEYLEGNPFRTLVDCSHAAEILGWQPQHSWREAL